MMIKSNFNLIHLVVSANGTYELQFDLTDEAGKLYMLIGSRSDGIGDSRRIDSDLFIEKLIDDGGVRTLLTKTELGVARKILAAAGLVYATIEYYAIVNTINCSLIAEHALTGSRSQHETAGKVKGGSGFWSRNHV